MPQEDWSEERLKLLVTNGQEETLQLEFKSGPALGKENRHSDEISKDVSALANAGGGTIIYGITETKTQPAKAAGFAGIDPAQFSRDWLNQKINSTILPAISGIDIRTVELATVDPGNVSYVVLVPEGRTAHQARDRKYYRRDGTENRAMDGFAIRDAMFRTRHALLDVEVHGRRSGSVADKISFEVEIKIVNVGTVRANQFKVEIGAPAELTFRHVRSGDSVPPSDQLRGLASVPYPEVIAAFGRTGDIPLFPNDTWNLRSTTLHLTEKLWDLMRERQMKVRWVIYADDMPPMHGERLLSEIIDF